MNATIERINEVGSAFVEFALPMLIQSGVLILILLLVDLLLRKRVRAVFRYWIWMLVLVKLVLPTSLSSPISVGRWFGDELAYVDTIPAPAPEPKADIVPIPEVEAPPILNMPPSETIARAPVVVPIEPTVRSMAPTPRQIESASTVPEPEPVVPPAPPAPPLSWQAAVLLVWLAVLSAMLLLLLQRAFFVRRLVGQAAAASGKMTDLLTHCAERMAVRREVGLKISAGATSPAVCGLFRPVILVPKKLTPSLSSAELRVVLLHELAHIKRRDLWVNFAQTLLQIFYFYNPLLWLANVMIRRAREQAVDEMVLVAMGERARQYPATLVNVAKLALKRPALSLRLIGVVESRSALTGRIKHILGRPMPKTAKLGILGLLVVVIAAAVLLPMAKAMKPKPSVVNNGPLDIRLVGVCPDGGDQLYDAAGRKLQTPRTLLSPWVTHWKDESQQRDFIFEIPDVDDQLTFLPFPRICPAGTDRGLGGGFRGYFDPTGNPSTLIQSITFDRTYRRQLFYLQLKEQIRHIDLTLRYFYGPRRQADCTFTGPFEMKQTVEADGAKAYSLTFQEAITADGSGIQLRFKTSEPFDSDRPAIMYDLSGRRYMLNSHSGSSGSSGADRKYQGVVVSPEKIAAITFGEKPHEITFRNVAVHFADRPHRTYPEFLNEMAKRLDLTGLSPKQLAEYRFKSPQEAIEVIDIVRGNQHVRHAFEAIKHSRPKVKISELDQPVQDKVRRTATRWAETGHLAKYGIELGLMGQWPEFFDMAVARLSEEIPGGNYTFDRRTWTQDNASIANVMVNHRMDQLTAEQVNKLKQLIRRTDSGSVLSHLLWYLEWTRSQPTSDALWELAQDQRPWIWWPATKAWHTRVSRTRRGYDDLTDKMKLRLFLIVGIPKDEYIKTKAPGLLKEIFTPQLGKMASQAWNKVREKISREFDKRSATETYIGYLRRVQSEMTARKWITDNYNAKWNVAYVIRNLNVWYGVNIANLSTDESSTPRGSEPRTHPEFQRQISEALAWYEANPDAQPVELPFAGRVVDTNGRPVAGAKLSFTELVDYKDASGDRGQRRVNVGQRMTDAEGRFSFNGFTNARLHILDVAANGFLPKEELHVQLLTDGRYRYRERTMQENNVIQLQQRSGKISGTAIAADGKPLANAELRLSAANPYSQKEPTTTVTTDSEGKFTAEDIASGPFLLSYAGPGSVPHGRVTREKYDGPWGGVRLETAEAGHLDSVFLDLSKSVCSLEIEVVDEAGAPVKEISFTLDAEMKGGSYRYASIFHVETTSEDGVYRFEGMPPGAWHMRLSYPQGGGHTELDIELTEARTARYKAVCEPPPASLEALRVRSAADRRVRQRSSDVKTGATRIIFLPDLETPNANTVLDLAGGQMLSAAGLEKDRQYFRKLGKGDLAYDYAGNEAALLCLRGATMQLRTDQGVRSLTPDVQRQYFVGYFLDKVPCQYRIATAEGDKYELKVLSVEKGDNGRVQIEYYKTDVQVQSETPWGELSDDVQCRLRPEKLVWRSGGALTFDDAINFESPNYLHSRLSPVFSLDLRNQGNRTIGYCRDPAMHGYEIEINGLWHRWARMSGGGAPVWPLNPGELKNDAIAVEMNGPWVPLETYKKLTDRPGFRRAANIELSPGKHIIRVRVPNHMYDSKDRVHVRKQNGPYATSNPVEIEVVPGEKSDVQVDGEERWSGSSEMVDSIPNAIPILRLEKPKYILGELIRFWVGVKCLDDDVRIPQEFWDSCFLYTTRPDGTVKEESVGWPMDGALYRGWNGGYGFGKEKVQIGKYTLVFEFANKKTKPVELIVEEHDVIKNIKAEFNFQRSGNISKGEHTPIILTVRNNSKHVIQFPRRGVSDARVSISVKRREPSRGSAFFYPIEKLKGPLKNEYDWNRPWSIPPIILEPGERFEHELFLEDAYEFWGTGQYQVTFSTALALVVGEKNGKFAEHNPIRLDVVATERFTVIEWELTNQETSLAKKPDVQVEGRVYSQETDCAVSGRVLAKPGGEGAVATVTLWSGENGKTLTTTSNANGNYRFENVKPSRYRYILRIRNKPGIWTEPVIANITGSDIRDQEIYLTLPQSISGIARDSATGEGVSNVALHFSAGTYGNRRDHAYTDAHGKYLLYVNPREVSINCRGADGYCPLSEYGEAAAIVEKKIVVESSRNLGNVDFNLRWSPVFTGQAVYPDGRPAAGVSVEAWVDHRNLPGFDIGSSGGSRMFVLKADQEGRFAGGMIVDGNMAGPVFERPKNSKVTKLEAKAWLQDGSLGGMVVAQPLPGTDAFDPVRIVLAKTGSLSFLVVDRNNNPVPNADVRFYGGETRILENQGQGRFVARNLIPGVEYEISAYPPGYYPELGNKGTFVVKPGEKLNAEKLILSRWGKKAVPGEKSAGQVEGEGIPANEETQDQVAKGLQVSIAFEKTTFALDEPIPVAWRIKNASREDKTIIWHEQHFSPVVFEIGKKGEKKYIREDSRRMFTGALPGPPVRIVLRPGDVKEDAFDLRYFGLRQSSGVYEVTGLYSPKDNRMLADTFLQKPEFKDINDTRIDSATTEVTLTENLGWLKKELSNGTFHGRLSAARRLAPIVGNKDVLAELETIYPAGNTREMVWLVDHMAQFGDLSHVPDVLDMYEADGYAPYWKDYGDDMLVFLLKWSGDRGIGHLIRYLSAHKDTVNGTAEHSHKRHLLSALTKGSYWYFEFKLNDKSLPLLILALDERTVQGGMTLESGKKVQLRWCDSAALVIQKMLKRDFGFKLELPEEHRDEIINQMRVQLTDRNSAGKAEGNAVSNNALPKASGAIDAQAPVGHHLFTVHGTVADQSGRPMEGVRLTADCGHGKLERTGRTVTDENGRYELVLTSSIKNVGADPYDVGIQTARIEARAKGFYEANICGGGYLAMAGKPPGPDEQRFVADYAGVVLPHKPYELNFVMRPAARIEGELVDGQDNPMPGLGLWLNGDNLYLSNRVNIYGRTDRNGKFIIDDIPCKSIWFMCPQPKSVQSGTVELTMPGTYRVKLRYVEWTSGEPSLTIAEFRPPAAKRTAASGSLQPDDISPPILGYDVKLNFADPISRDGSFHGDQSVVFSLSFHKIENPQTDTLFGSLLVGRTTWPVLLQGDRVTIQDGSAGKTIRSESWSSRERQFDLVLRLPLTYGQKRYACPVHVEMVRTDRGVPMGSYWFCAYLSGRLPWGAGGRIFEIVNLDQQMEFRPVGDGTDKRDAVLGIDINGDGKIDPAQSGGEQFDLYEPFKIGSKTYRVREVDPYSPRVAFVEVKPGQLPGHAPGIDAQDEGTPGPNEPTYGGRSLTELIAALGLQDLQARTKAVYHLGYMGPKARPAVPALVDALDEERLRESILHSLSNIGTGAEEAIPALMEAIAEYAPACRWTAAEALAKIGKPAVPALKKAGGSEDIYLRIWCNAALAKQQGGDSPNLRYLAQLMKNADKNTASEAVRALTMLGPVSRPVVPDLVEALKYSAVPKKHIAFALAQIGKDARPAVPELAKMLQAADLGTRADAIYALSRIGGPDIAPAVPLLIQALKTDDASHTVMASRVRYTAATALGNVGPDARPAIPALAVALGDSDEFVRTNAAEAIGNIDPTDLRAVPVLVEAMEDESGRVRVAAAQSLLKIGPVNRDVVLAFVRAADDNWKGIIYACDEFFRLLGPQHSYAVPELIEMLKKPAERSQRLAIIALGRIGPAAAPAAPYILESMKNPNLEAICSGPIAKIGADPGVTVPKLIEMLKDKHKRSSAALALERIGPAAHRAIPALENCSEESNSTTFPRALLAIDSNSRRGIESLVRISESAYVPGQWSEQPDAHYLLVKYGHDKAEHFKKLVAALENPNSRIRLSAASYLGKLGAEAHEAGESFVRALKDNDPEVRAEAAHALLLTGATQPQRRQACNVLIDLLDGEEFAGHDGLFMAQVRAAAALHSFSPLEQWAVPWLIEKLQDTDNSVRTGSIKMRVCVGAIKALENIGPAASEALPHLMPLLRNSNWHVREAATEAIEKIDNESAVQARAETTGAAKVAKTELSGRVVDEEGEQVAGAQVALSTDRIGVMVSHGKLKPIRKAVESRIVQTDSEGDFDLGQPPAGSFDLIVAHENGSAFVESGQFIDSREIRLQPWGRIEGRVATGAGAGGRKIWMAELPNSTWLLHKREYRYETECDADGRFVFEKVPADWFEAGYLIRTGEMGASITSRTPVEVKAGEMAKMMLGGSGRPVIGKFVPPAGYDKPIYFGNGLRDLITTRPDEPRPENYDRMTRREQEQWRSQWRKGDEFRQYRDAYWHDPNWRQYTFRIDNGGSFRIEDVIAGRYDFTVWIEERPTGRGRPEEIASYDGTIEVPEMPGGRSDEPLDLGELELRIHEPLRVGDVAPLFEAKTLDGRNVKLIDYRGKFVLLSFWQPVSHPEIERLRELYDSHNAGGRLEIIGFGGHDTLEEVIKYIVLNNISWPQVFTGDEFRAGIAKNYRMPGIPWIFLIDPDGKIAATGLRSERLESAVREALGSETDGRNRIPETSELTGMVVDEEGKPVADAQVALSAEGMRVKISHGKLEPVPFDTVRTEIVQTDATGEFAFEKRPSGPFDFIVAHDRGFALVESDTLVDSHSIQLRPWGRIEGRLAIEGSAGGTPISLSILPSFYAIDTRRQYQYYTGCDESGRFVFEKVPAGLFAAGYRSGNGNPTCKTPVEVRSGATSHVTLGGTGRPVIGKFVPPAGYGKPLTFGRDVCLGGMRKIEPQMPLPENYMQWSRRRQLQWQEQWLKTDEFKKFRDSHRDKNWRSYELTVDGDGTFRADDVIAGRYALHLHLEEWDLEHDLTEFLANFSDTVEVPEMPGGRSDEPLDLGKFVLTMHEPLRVGDVAPLFEVTTLEGENLKLIAYRGKFVLLSFWAPRRSFRTPRESLTREHVQDVHDTYGTDGRLAIIGLGVYDTLEEVRKYAEENSTPWPQIFAGRGLEPGIAKDYRGPIAPSALLIGPDGRIAGKVMRGDKLKAVVYDALTKTDQHGPVAPVESEGVKPPVWINFLPRSPIRSLVDYKHSQNVEPLESGDAGAKSCELEIRSAKDHARIARIRFESYPFNKREQRKGCSLSRQQLQQIGWLEDGDYFVALYADGIRCSNVADLTIDSDLQSKPGPVLQLIPFPLGPEQRLPRIGVRVTGPSPVDPKLDEMAITHPELIVDGVTRQLGGWGWFGSNVVAVPGAQEVAILNLESYQPAISLYQAHIVKAIVGRYESAPVRIPVDDTAGLQWDAATAHVQVARKAVQQATASDFPDELRVNEDGTRASFPDVSDGVIIRAAEARGVDTSGSIKFLKMYDAVRRPLDELGTNRLQLTEGMYKRSKEKFDELVATPNICSIYAQRWLVILDWLAENIDAGQAAKKLTDLSSSLSDVHEASFTRAFAVTILSRDGHAERAREMFMQCRPELTPQWGWFAFDLHRQSNIYVAGQAPNVDRVVGGRIVQTARTKQQWQKIEEPLRNAQTAYADYLENDFLPMAARYITSVSAGQYPQTEHGQVIDTLRQLVVSHHRSFSLGATTDQIEQRVRSRILLKVLATWQKSLDLVEYPAVVAANEKEIKGRCKKLGISENSLPRLWEELIEEKQSPAVETGMEVRGGGGGLAGAEGNGAPELSYSVALREEEIDLGGRAWFDVELRNDGKDPVTVFWGDYAYEDQYLFRITHNSGRTLAPPRKRFMPSFGGLSREHFERVPAGGTLEYRLVLTPSPGANCQTYYFREPGDYVVDPRFLAIVVSGDEDGAGGGSGFRELWRGYLPAERVSFTVGKTPAGGKERELGHVSIKGQVLDSDGIPIAGADVTVSIRFQSSASIDGHAMREVARERTDGDGRFRIGRLPDDCPFFELTARHPKYADDRSRMINRPPKSEYEARLILRKALTIGGKVVDNAGNAIAGARVTGHTGHSRREVHTDAEGRFTLDGVVSRDGKTVSCDVWKKGWIHQYPRISVDIARGRTWKITMESEQDHSFAGKAVFADGPLAADMKVMFDLTNAEGQGVWAKEKTTDREGRFTAIMKKQEPVSGRIWLEEQSDRHLPHGLWQTTVTDLHAGRDEVEFVFDRSGVIRVNIEPTNVLPAGRELRVTCYMRARSYVGWIPVGQEKVGPSGGTVKFPDLSAGRYRVKVADLKAEGWNWAQEIELAAQDGQMNPELTFRLPELHFGSVRARALQPDGRTPLKAGRVWLDSAVSWGRRVDMRDGDIWLPEVPVGNVSLRFNIAGCAPRKVRAMVRPSQTTDFGDIILATEEQGTGWVQGRILFDDGTPALGAAIIGDYFKHVPVKADGSFRRQLPIGKLQIAIDISGAPLWPRSRLGTDVVSSHIGRSLAEQWHDRLFLPLDVKPGKTIQRDITIPLATLGKVEVKWLGDPDPNDLFCALAVRIGDSIYSCHRQSHPLLSPEMLKDPVTDVPAGHRIVILRTSKYSGYQESRSGERNSVFTFDPSQAGSVSGTVKLATGASAGGVRVELLHPLLAELGPVRDMRSTFGMRPGAKPGSTKTAEDGSFRFPHVAPGRYVVSATSWGDSASQSIEVRKDAEILTQLTMHVGR